jgi:hypothetical protein
MISKALANMQRHVLELKRLVQRMDPGPAKDRVQARYEEAQTELRKLREMMGR